MDSEINHQLLSLSLRMSLQTLITCFVKCNLLVDICLFDIFRYETDKGMIFVYHFWAYLRIIYFNYSLNILCYEEIDRIVADRNHGIYCM